jgi:hypothetical protein
MRLTGEPTLNYLFKGKKQEEENYDVEKIEVGGRCNGSGFSTLSWSERPGSFKLRGKSAAHGGNQQFLLSKLSSSGLSWQSTLPGSLIFVAIGILIAYNSGRSNSGQMHSILSNIPMVLWFSGIATQLFLACLLLRRKAYKNYPWFSIHILQFNLASAILLAFRYSGHTYSYLIGFYVSATIDALIGILVIGELSVVTFGPTKVRSRMLTLYLGAAMAITYLIVGMGGTFFMAANPWRRGAQLMLALAAATLWVMVMFKEKLELYWSARARGIAHGMLLYLTVDLITSFMNGRVSHATAELAGDLSQLAYLIATILWIKAFWQNHAPLALPDLGELGELRCKLDDGSAEVELMENV